MQTIQARIDAMSPSDRLFILDVLYHLENRAAAAVPVIVRRIEGRDYWRAAGDRLRQVRQQLGLSEIEAAQSYGVHLQTYRRYERGHAQRARHHKLVDFAKRHEISLDWLIEGTGEMFRGAGPAPSAGGNVVAFRGRQ